MNVEFVGGDKTVAIGDVGDGKVVLTPGGDLFMKVGLPLSARSETERATVVSLDHGLVYTIENSARVTEVEATVVVKAARP